MGAAVSRDRALAPRVALVRALPRRLRTLALNPRVWGEPGWQLSFAAVVGILLLAPGIDAG